MKQRLKNQIIIVRSGFAQHERSVLVTNARGEAWFFDPAKELGEALGGWMPRHRCILSFAEGIKAAGRNVVIARHFIGAPINRTWVTGEVSIPAVPAGPLTLEPAYWLLGLAFARNCWYGRKLKEELKRIYDPAGRDYELRWSTWYQTAIQYATYKKEFKKIPQGSRIKLNRNLILV
ncbi:MAG: hypothetical protein CMI53_03175 [Parcubacteria group bacterium]|jgi:hypothetical protein|nr:hypothetical protein [Parcubacteria group bacterium]|tara:strand:+ start:4934 stop:5464 length:531 start_codon:yes stop_codon:yes gene_type:complete